MSLTNLNLALPSNQPMPIYSGLAGELRVMVNVTVDDARVVFTGLTKKNFDVILWNPSGQALTFGNSLSDLSVFESPERPGVYFLSVDWAAGTTQRPDGGGVKFLWLGAIGGTYVAAIRMHEDGATFIGQTIFSFQAAYAEPKGEA
jgi:hypothetical protein